MSGLKAPLKKLNDFNNLGIPTRGRTIGGSESNVLFVDIPDVKVTQGKHVLSEKKATRTSRSEAHGLETKSLEEARLQFRSKSVSPQIAIITPKGNEQKVLDNIHAAQQRLNSISKSQFRLDYVYRDKHGRLISKAAEYKDFLYVLELNKLTVDQLRHLLGQIILGLEDLFNSNIAHMDIKFINILVEKTFDDQLRIKIADLNGIKEIDKDTGQLIQQHQRFSYTKSNLPERLQSKIDDNEPNDNEVFAGEDLRILDLYALGTNLKIYVEALHAPEPPDSKDLESSDYAEKLAKYQVASRKFQAIFAENKEADHLRNKIIEDEGLKDLIAKLTQDDQSKNYTDIMREIKSSPFFGETPKARKKFFKDVAAHATEATYYDHYLPPKELKVDDAFILMPAKIKEIYCLVENIDIQLDNFEQFLEGYVNHNLEVDPYYFDKYSPGEILYLIEKNITKSLLLIESALKNKALSQFHDQLTVLKKSLQNEKNRLVSVFPVMSKVKNAPEAKLVSSNTKNKLKFFLEAKVEKKLLVKEAVKKALTFKSKSSEPAKNIGISLDQKHEQKFDMLSKQDRDTLVQQMRETEQQERKALFYKLLKDELIASFEAMVKNYLSLNSKESYAKLGFFDRLGKRIVHGNDGIERVNNLKDKIHQLNEGPLNEIEKTKYIFEHVYRFLTSSEGNWWATSSKTLLMKELQNKQKNKLTPIFAMDELRELIISNDFADKVQRDVDLEKQDKEWSKKSCFSCRP